jgi:methylglutamate dehydrogenase subunit D
MAERLSALAIAHEAGGDGRVVLSEWRANSILQLQAWPDAIDRVLGVITGLTDVRTPEPGHAAHAPGLTLAAIAPGRFMIAGDANDLAARFQEALTITDATVADISHGRTILLLEGDTAAELLQSCAQVDLDPAVFRPGRVAQTMIHHVDVIIVRQTETRFQLWVLRSFAQSLAEWLLDAGTGTRLEKIPKVTSTVNNTNDFYPSFFAR